METKTLKNRNHIFEAMPTNEWERLLPFIETIELPLGKVLYEPGTKMSHVIFPSSAIVSLLYALENGSSAEIAVVGNEGVVGISIFMGGESTSSRAVVQSAGVPSLYLLRRRGSAARTPGMKNMAGAINKPQIPPQNAPTLPQVLILSPEVCIEYIRGGSFACHDESFGCNWSWCEGVSINRSDRLVCTKAHIHVK